MFTKALVTTKYATVRGAIFLVIKSKILTAFDEKTRYLLLKVMVV